MQTLIFPPSKSSQQQENQESPTQHTYFPKNAPKFSQGIVVPRIQHFRSNCELVLLCKCRDRCDDHEWNNTTILPALKCPVKTPSDALHSKLALARTFMGPHSPSALHSEKASICSPQRPRRQHQSKSKGLCHNAYNSAHRQCTAYLHVSEVRTHSLTPRQIWIHAWIYWLILENKKGSILSVILKKISILRVILEKKFNSLSQIAKKNRVLWVILEKEFHFSFFLTTQGSILWVMFLCRKVQFFWVIWKKGPILRITLNKKFNFWVVLKKGSICMSHIEKVSLTMTMTMTHSDKVFTRGKPCPTDANGESVTSSKTLSRICGIPRVSAGCAVNACESTSGHSHRKKKPQEKWALKFAMWMRVTRFTKSSPEMNSRIKHG